MSRDVAFTSFKRAIAAARQLDGSNQSNCGRLAANILLGLYEKAHLACWQQQFEDGATRIGAIAGLQQAAVFTDDALADGEA